MGRNVTWTVVAMAMMWISGTSSIALPGLDLSTSVDDPEPFHLPPYLSPVGEGSRVGKAQSTIRSPPTQKPASHRYTVGKNGDTFSNYLIKSLTQMDANTLKTLSNIINLELNKQVPSHQIQGQVQSQTLDKVNVQSQTPESINTGQYPQISQGITSGSSSSQYQASSMARGSQINQEVQGYSHSSSLSNKLPVLNSGQAPVFSQQTIDSSANQQPQMGAPVSQSQFNPGHMTASSMGSGDGHKVLGIPSSMFQTAVVGTQPSASNVEVDTSFDPNRLMASIKAETSQYNPNAFTAKQNYITANQWNYANQKVPQHTQYVNQIQTDNSAVQQHKKPNIMETAQLNFDPDVMMTALGIKGQRFTFDPDKINSFGSSGFQPGLYPQSSGDQKLPKNMFNADTVNKMLMSYGVEPKYQPKQQPKKGQTSQVVHKSVYNPDTFNHPAVNTLPSTYLQFIGNEGSATVQPFANNQIHNGKTSKQLVSIPSQNGDKFRTQSLSPISDVDGTFLIKNTLQSVKFNPDQINAAQRHFDPDLLYRSLFFGRGRQALPSTHMTKSLRKSARDENRTDIVEINSPEPQTTSPNPKYAGLSTTLSSIVRSTKQPETTVTSTKSTAATGTDGLTFNPDNVNAGIAQMMNFSPGSLMMGYNQVPAGNMVNAAYNPNQINQMGKFQSAMSPMMEALMGESGRQSNTGSQAASQPNYDQSQGMSTMFNPADVNQAKISFDISQQMGFNENSGNAMFDPMKVNVLANQNFNKLVGVTNVNNNSFFSSNGMRMDNFVFTGVFDPNKVNQASMTDIQVNKYQNSSSSSSMMNYMSAFLGMGSFGGTGGSAFGGSFNPSEVNTAVFDPNDVNNAQMNFDPSDMLERNRGYDSEKASQTNFDPSKINDIHMNFQPPFLPVDKNNSTSSNAFSQYNSKFTPGQLSPNGNAMVFYPDELNQANMHFNAGDIFNSTDIGNPIVLQSSTHFNLQVPNKNSNIAMPIFDPVAVNNMQMNFVPNSGLVAYQSSITTSGTEPKPITSSISTRTTPTTTSQTTPTIAPSPISSPPNSTDVH